MHVLLPRLAVWMGALVMDEPNLEPLPRRLLITQEGSRITVHPRASQESLSSASSICRSALVVVGVCL